VEGPIGLTASGKPVVIAVHASWCPTCKTQIPIQTELMQSPEFKDYTMFIVDFDKDTDVLKRFHVAKQSTMIVFRGKTEVGRSVGDTQRASLEALMLKARNSSG
jgi:thiol-disulfide isomerase/thioredoxin